MFLRKWSVLFRCTFRSRRGGSRPKLGLHRFRPIVELLENRLVPSIITVTTLTDPLKAGNGLVSFRDAILASGTHTSVDGCLVGTGNDTIVFAPGLSGTIDLSIVGDKSFGPSAFLINDNLTIQGPATSPGITIQRDSTAPVFRLFNVAAGASLTLKNLTVSGGLAQGGKGGPAAGEAEEAPA